MIPLKSFAPDTTALVASYSDMDVRLESTEHYLRQGVLGIATGTGLVERDRCKGGFRSRLRGPIS
jgi:hypothetical protein